MREELKQRLVGALVLLALGVVFWPIIFVEPDAVSLPERRPMPVAPELDRSELPPMPRSPLDERAAEDAGAQQQQVLDAEAADLLAERIAAGSEGSPGEGVADPEPEPRSEPPEAVALDDRGLPIAWCLHVATLSDLTRARALRDSLVDAGHKAYLRTLGGSGRRLHRVSVGPRLERAPLEALKPAIDRRYGVDSLLARYEP